MEEDCCNSDVSSSNLTGGQEGNPESSRPNGVIQSKGAESNPSSDTKLDEVEGEGDKKDSKDTPGPSSLKGDIQCKEAEKNLSSGVNELDEDELGGDKKDSDSNGIDSEELLTFEKIDVSPTEILEDEKVGQIQIDSGGAGVKMFIVSEKVDESKTEQNVESSPEKKISVQDTVDCNNVKSETTNFNGEGVANLKKIEVKSDENVVGSRNKSIDNAFSELRKELTGGNMDTSSPVTISSNGQSPVQEKIITVDNKEVETSKVTLSTPNSSLHSSPQSTPPQKRSVISKITSKGTQGSKSSSPMMTPDTLALFRIPFKHGWKREVVYRNNSDGQRKQCDIYYFTPEGKKLRSMVQIRDHLDKMKGSPVTVAHFSFSRTSLHEPPFEIVRDAGKVGTRTLLKKKTSVDKSSSGMPVLKKSSIAVTARKNVSAPNSKPPILLKAVGLVSGGPGVNPIVTLNAGRKRVRTKFTPLRRNVAPLKVKRSTKLLLKKKLQASVSSGSSSISDEEVEVIKHSAGGGKPGPSKEFSFSTEEDAVRSVFGTPSKLISSIVNPPASSSSNVSTAQTAFLTTTVTDNAGKPAVKCRIIQKSDGREFLLHLDKNGQQVKTPITTAPSQSLGQEGASKPKIIILPQLPKLQQRPSVISFSNNPVLQSQPISSGVPLMVPQPPPLISRPILIKTMQNQSRPNPMTFLPGPPRLQPAMLLSAAAQGPQPILPKESSIRSILNQPSPFPAQAPSVSTSNSANNSDQTRLSTEEISARVMKSLMKDPGLRNIPSLNPGALPTNQSLLASFPNQSNNPQIYPHLIMSSIGSPYLTDKFNTGASQCLQNSTQPLITTNPNLVVTASGNSRTDLEDSGLSVAFGHQNDGSIYSRATEPDIPVRDCKEFYSVFPQTSTKLSSLLNVAPTNVSSSSQEKQENIITLSDTDSCEIMDQEAVPASDRRRAKLQRARRRHMCPFRVVLENYTIAMNILKRLSVPNLLRATRVCKSWYRMATQNRLWRDLSLRGFHVNNWDNAVEFFCKVGVRSLDFKDMVTPPDVHYTAHDVIRALGKMTQLRAIHFGAVSQQVMDTILEKIPQLEDVGACIISSSPDPSNVLTDIRRHNFTEDAVGLAVDSIMSGLMSVDEAASFSKVSLMELKHLIKGNRSTLSKSEEASVLLCCLRLSHMGFNIDQAVMDMRVNDEVVKCYNTPQISPAICKIYSEDLYRKNMNFFQTYVGYQPKDSMFIKLKAYFANLRQKYKDYGVIRSTNLYSLVVERFEVLKTQGNRVFKVTAISLVSPCSKTLPVMLVFPNCVHPPDIHQNVILVSAKEGQPPSTALARYIRVITSKLSERPLLILCDGSELLFSEEVVSECLKNSVMLHCVPRELSPYVFPGRFCGILHAVDNTLGPKLIEEMDLVKLLSSTLQNDWMQLWKQMSFAFQNTGTFPVVQDPTNAFLRKLISKSWFSTGSLSGENLNEVSISPVATVNAAANPGRPDTDDESSLSESESVSAESIISEFSDNQLVINEDGGKGDKSLEKSCSKDEAPSEKVDGKNKTSPEKARSKDKSLEKVEGGKSTAEADSKDKSIQKAGDKANTSPEKARNVVIQQEVSDTTGETKAGVKGETTVTQLPAKVHNDKPKAQVIAESPKPSGRDGGFSVRLQNRRKSSLEARQQEKIKGPANVSKDVNDKPKGFKDILKAKILSKVQDVDQNSEKGISAKNNQKITVLSYVSSQKAPKRSHVSEANLLEVGTESQTPAKKKPKLQPENPLAKADKITKGAAPKATETSAAQAQAIYDTINAVIAASRQEYEDNLKKLFGANRGDKKEEIAGEKEGGHSGLKIKLSKGTVSFIGDNASGAQESDAREETGSEDEELGSEKSEMENSLDTSPVKSSAAETVEQESDKENSGSSDSEQERKKKKKLKKKRKKKHRSEAKHDDESEKLEGQEVGHNKEKHKKKKKKKKKMKKKKSNDAYEASEKIEGDENKSIVPSTEESSLVAEPEKVDVEDKEKSVDAADRKLLRMRRISLADHDYVAKFDSDSGNDVSTKEQVEEEIVEQDMETENHSSVFNGEDGSNQTENEPLDDNVATTVEVDDNSKAELSETNDSSSDSSSGSGTSSSSSSEGSHKSSNSSSSSNSDNSGSNKSKSDGSSSDHEEDDNSAEGKSEDDGSASDDEEASKVSSPDTAPAAKEGDDDEEEDDDEDGDEEDDDEDEGNLQVAGVGSEGSSSASEEEGEEASEVEVDDDSKCQLCMMPNPPHTKEVIIDWVDCDGNCGRWFHVICIQRSHSKADPKHYVCPSCRCKR